jgi:hypothetical protein
MGGAQEMVPIVNPYTLDKRLEELLKTFPYLTSDAMPAQTTISSGDTDLITCNIATYPQCSEKIIRSIQMLI